MYGLDYNTDPSCIYTTDEPFPFEPSLKKISLHSSIERFGIDLFDGVEDIEITGSITSIPEKMFYK